MPNKRQADTEKYSALPNRLELWSRIVEVLGTDNQNEIARKLGVQPPSVSEWKTGKSLPKLDKLIEIAELGNASLDYLLKGVGGSELKEVLPSSEEFSQRWRSNLEDMVTLASSLQYALSRFNGELAELLHDVAAVEASNLYGDVDIPDDQKVSNTYELLAAFLIYEGLLSLGLSARDIDFGPHDPFIKKFSFFAGKRPNVMEAEMRRIVREELKLWAPNSLAAQIEGEEFDIAFAVRRYDDPARILEAWYNFDGTPVPSEVGTLAFSGWDNYSLDQKVEEIKAYRAIRERQRKRRGHAPPKNTRKP